MSNRETDPNNPFGFGLPISAWDANRINVKEILAMKSRAEIIGKNLKISANPLVLKGGPVCVSGKVIVDTIEGKYDPENINIAGVPIVFGKIPTSALDQAPLLFKSCWDAGTNIPPLVSGVGNNGDYYLVCNPGNTILDGNNSWGIGDAVVFSSDSNTWFKVGTSNVTLTSSGTFASVPLVYNSNGPAISTKGLTAGTNLSMTPTASDITITNSSLASDITLTNLGATTLINSGTGPFLGMKGLSAGSDISLTSNLGDITIANTDTASNVTLANTGVESIVNTGSGPNIKTKGLVAGTGINLFSTGTDVTIENSSPISSASLTSTGTGQTLVKTGTQPAYSIKGLTAGTGISLSATGTDITITNTDLGSSTTLMNAGVESIVNIGVGPALALKGVIAGPGISLSGAALNVIITNTISSANLTNAGGTETIVSNGSGPSLSTKGIVAGTNVTLSATGTDLTISSVTLSATLSNAGIAISNETIVNNGTAPNLSTKGLNAGTGISLSGNTTDLTITNSSMASGMSLTNAGVAVGNETLVSGSGSGTALLAKGLVGGTNILLSNTSTDVTITNLAVQGLIVYFCGGASNTSGFLAQNGFLSTGGVSPGSFSTQLILSGPYYDPLSGYNSGTGALGISPSKRYLSDWAVPIGTYTDVIAPIGTPTLEFQAWSRCFSSLNPFLASFGNVVAYGGGGSGIEGNQICSSGTTTVNVFNNLGNQTANPNIILNLYNQTTSVANIDVGLHGLSFSFPGGSGTSTGQIGSKWTVFEF